MRDFLMSCDVPNLCVILLYVSTLSSVGIVFSLMKRIDTISGFLNKFFGDLKDVILKDEEE